MQRQRGFIASGLLGWVLLLGIAGFVAFQVVPAYLEYASIKRQFRAIADDPAVAGAGRTEVENAFARRASTENISVIQPRDLQVTNAGGRVVINASYTARVPLFGNLSMCLDFYPSSAK